MRLHQFYGAFFLSQHQCWRGSAPLMHLHEKIHIKRAGVAGRALRASLVESVFFRGYLIDRITEPFFYG